MRACVQAEAPRTSGDGRRAKESAAPTLSRGKTRNEADPLFFHFYDLSPLIKEVLRPYTLLEFKIFL